MTGENRHLVQLTGAFLSFLSDLLVHPNRGHGRLRSLKSFDSYDLASG